MRALPSRVGPQSTGPGPHCPKPARRARAPGKRCHPAPGGAVSITRSRHPGVPSRIGARKIARASGPVTTPPRRRPETRPSPSRAGRPRSPGRRDKRWHVRASQERDQDRQCDFHFEIPHTALERPFSRPLPTRPRSIPLARPRSASSETRGARAPGSRRRTARRRRSWR